MAASPNQDFYEVVAEIRKTVQYDIQVAHRKCQSLLTSTIAIPQSPTDTNHNDVRFIMIETLKELRTEIALEITRRTPPPPPPPTNVVRFPKNN